MKRSRKPDADDEVERPIRRSPRTLENVVHECALGHMRAGEVRALIAPIVTAYTRARGVPDGTWDMYCEWRGSTLRCVIYGAKGEEIDLRSIPVPEVDPEP